LSACLSTYACHLPRVSVPTSGSSLLGQQSGHFHRPLCPAYEFLRMRCR